MTHVEPAAEVGCRTAVLTPKGEAVFSDEEWDISLDKKDIDINRDGRADMVLRGYSGGAHCCWTYWIIAPSRRPALLKKLENERHIQFEDHDGAVTLAAQDGKFDYFDGLCHACTAFPDIYLKMNGDKIIDVSPQYLSHYDDEIKSARLKLIHEHLEDFLSAKNPEQMLNAGQDIKPLVLTVVLAYLYSGREQQAWKALDEMWPAFDRQRIKKLILKTRAEGLMRYVDKKPRRSNLYSSFGREPDASQRKRKIPSAAPQDRLFGREERALRMTRGNRLNAT